MRYSNENGDNILDAALEIIAGGTPSMIRVQHSEHESRYVVGHVVQVVETFERDKSPITYIKFAADYTLPLRNGDRWWIVTHEGLDRPEPEPFVGTIDAVAARLKDGNIVGYEEAEVVERLAPDAWRVVFTADGHSAGVFEHELRLRPGDIDRLRAMEVGQRRQ